jgi:hypothetical protein
MDLGIHKEYILEKGFTVINNVFSDEEVEKITHLIQNIDTSKENFRKSEDLFAIRQFLKEIPEIREAIFNENIKAIIKNVFGRKIFCSKEHLF